MKSISFSTLILAAAVVAALSLSMTSCKEDPQSANPQQVFPMGNHPVVWNAHPEIVYSLDTTVNRNSQRGLWVMDSTGSNWKCIYTNSSATNDFWDPNWSGDGNSAAFISYASGTGISTLYRIDISTSNGVPVGSNLTSLTTVSYADSELMEHIEWSPNTSNNVVAFATYNQRAPWVSKVATIQTVSASGGTPTVVYSDTDARFMGLTWSPDGSFIAVVVLKGWGGRYLRIIDLNGNVRHQYTFSAGYGLPKWSRTSGKIAMGYGYTISTVDTGSGALSTVCSTAEAGFSWSPTDWKIVYSSTSSPFPDSTVVVAAGTKAKLHASGHYPNWRRQ